MHIPFMLEGNVIHLHRFSLSYMNEKEPVVEYFENIQILDYRKNMLKTEGISDFEVSELDVAELEWLEGISIGKSELLEDGVKMWQMGEAGYKQYLYDSNTELQMATMLLDLDYRLGLREMGVKQ